ncbi:hypothetical protein G7Y89_g11564 [Cudoniella acicularis]|uniref:Bacteriophage T5 Orf172 DNA-binding domain-containing protein n=1 Tax=Cudoniella acicularis TaxID=354080 RepID=A0A8H4W0J0_9HELO|nr:hypothetical protein G7Y89_g11564 [Cudoniella acicularis]
MTEQPAIPNQTTTAPWPTSLKITLNLAKRLFSPRFRCSPLGTSKHTVLCSCSQITAFNSNDSKQAILFDFPLDSNKPRFVFYEAVRVEKARQLCEAAAKRIDSADFLLVVHELLSNLAKICEGKATPDTKKKAGDTNLKPFRTDLLDNKSVCEELRTKICAPLNPSEARDHGLGYIYILRSQSYGTLAELKIGFSKHHPEHRAHQLAGCLRSPELVAHSPLIPHANRIETIIHAELVSLRKTQFCAQCQRQHQEWFTISHIHARQVVTRWCRWVLSQPYRNGRLTSQWRDHLNKKDFNQHAASARVSRIWTEIIDSYPIDESMESADEQIALYVNAIFLEKNLRSLCDLLQLPALKGDFADLMRIARVIRNRYGELGSSTGKIDIDFFYLFDSVIDFTRPRSSASKDSLTEDLSAFREGSELANYLGSIKTGCMSVSSPDLGVSESPMGDATLLPVVTLKGLEHFNGQAKLGIGYNPTHIGFQFLQEAYQRDEWEGPLPRFERPKGPRFFSASKPPSQYQQAKENSPSHKAPRKSHVADAPSSYRMKEHELRSNQESVFTTTSPGAGSSPQKRKVQTAPPDYPDIEMSSGDSKSTITEVTYTPGEDGEKSRMTFTAPLTDNLIDQVNKIQEEIKNGGRANVERKLNESLRYFGIETMAQFADDSTSEDEESSEEDDLLSFSQATPARNPSNQDKSGTRGIFSKNSVAKWFELS